MAMNGDNMATEIIAAINTLSAADKGDSEKVWKKVCGALINHLKTNMDINTYKAFQGGTPVPNDGGAALKTAWSTSPNKISGPGVVE